jgi:pimeloyl-ACP methyl ester carboxylesterase
VQDPGVAESDMERDVRMTMRGTFTGLRLEAVIGPQGPDQPRNLVDRLAPPDELPDWFSAADLEHYVTEFTRTGFTGGLSWFRNFDRNWELTPHLAGALLAPPTLYLAGAADPFVIACPPALMDGWLTDHRGTVLIDGAGHWVHQQRPDEVNDALLRFVADVLPTVPVTGGTPVGSR